MDKTAISEWTIQLFPIEATFVKQAIRDLAGHINPEPWAQYG